MDSSFSLFASQPVASLDVAARAGWAPALPPSSSSLAPALLSGPRLAPLVPGTNLNVPPSSVGQASWRHYELFPEQSSLPTPSPHFIAQAESLKRLLALPYSSAPLSLAVHRLGGTLLVDSDERVVKALSKSGLEAGRHPAEARRPSAQQLKPGGGTSGLLEAKLLFHSLSVEASLRALEAEEPVEPHANPQRRDEGAALGALVLWSDQGEAATTATAGSDGALQLRGASRALALASLRPEATSPHQAGHSETRWAPPRSAASPPGSFDIAPRLFEWHLESHRIVVESQLVLFRSPQRQAISLKLMSVNDRVTRLMCLSAWLDNLFAAVPELAVCWHKEGVVTGYEVVQSDGIPALCEPAFEPAEVLACGRSVLAFLQRNCTREDATYWLKRDPDGLLQLYDVTALLRVKDAPESFDQQAPSGLPEGATPASPSSMGHLCLRLAMHLPEASPGAAADRWRLLERACSLIDCAAQPAAAVAALKASAAACLCLSAFELEALLSGHEEGEEEAEKGTPLLPSPPAVVQDDTEKHAVGGPAATAAALPPLALDGHQWSPPGASQAGLRAALSRLRRARAAADAPPLRCLEAAVCVQLCRSSYNTAAPALALAWAQQAVQVCPRAPAALALLGDTHAALRLPGLASHAAAATWRQAFPSQATAVHRSDERRLPPTLRDACALAPCADGGLHRDAACTAYSAALDAMAELAEPSPRASTEHDEPNSVWRCAAGWPHAGCGPGGVRALRRRLASILNERGQHAVSVRGFEDAGAAFAQACALFRAAQDAPNEALVARNAAHALRARTLLADAQLQPEGWQLREYTSAASLCRGAARALKRRETSPQVWDVVHLELGRTRLAEGVLRSLSPSDDAAAGEALTDALQVLCALGAGAAMDAAVAHFHFGEVLCRRQPGASSTKLPRRHFEAALGFFGPKSFPVDHMRCRLRLSALALAQGAYEQALQLACGGREALVALPDTAQAERQAMGDLLDDAMLTALREAARQAQNGSDKQAANAKAAFESAIRAKAAGLALEQRLADAQLTRGLAKTT